MSPSIALDSSDFSTNQSTSGKTLLLSPPSLSSHPDKLNAAFLSCDRNVTDLQMLDRLELGLVSLPSSSYDYVLILADADSTFTENPRTLGRETFAKIVQSLKPGGHLRSQAEMHGSFDSLYHTEAILAGLIRDKEGGFQKPSSVQQAVPLQLGKKKKGQHNRQNVTPSSSSNNGPSIVQPSQSKKPIGVGFVDFSDDFGRESAPSNSTYSDDELIDEDALLGDDDLGRPIAQRKYPVIAFGGKIGIL